MAPSVTKTKKVEKEEDSGIMKPISYAEADVSRKDETDDAFSPVLRYSILGIICLVSFLIRLFAVVRYESVTDESEGSHIGYPRVRSLVQLPRHEVPVVVRTLRVPQLDGRSLLVSSGPYCGRHGVPRYDGHLLHLPQGAEHATLHDPSAQHVRVHFPHLRRGHRHRVLPPHLRGGPLPTRSLVGHASHQHGASGISLRGSGSLVHLSLRGR